MDIKATCTRCGKPVEVSEGVKFIAVSTCKECESDVTFRYKDSSGNIVQGVLKPGWDESLLRVSKEV